MVDGGFLRSCSAAKRSRCLPIAPSPSSSVVDLVPRCFPPTSRHLKYPSQLGPGSVRTISLNRSHSVAAQISVCAWPKVQMRAETRLLSRCRSQGRYRDSRTAQARHSFRATQRPDTPFVWLPSLAARVAPDLSANEPHRVQARQHDERRYGDPSQFVCEIMIPMPVIHTLTLINRARLTVKPEPSGSYRGFRAA